MNIRRLLPSSLLIATLAFALTLDRASFADEGAQAFVQREHVHVAELLKQPASPARDTQINKALDAMVDYDELTRRAFGQPCPVTVPSCTNHWPALSDAQKAEVTDLLKRLVEKNYRKNLIKTLDYEIIYKGERQQAGDAKIRTEAKSKIKPRDPAVQVDYVVRGSGANYRVVDIVTEGSSLTKNYYDQFHKMLLNPSQGYPHIVTKLKQKIEKRD